MQDSALCIADGFMQSPSSKSVTLKLKKNLLFKEMSAKLTGCDGFAVLHRGAHKPLFASSWRSSDGGLGAVLASAAASSALSSF